MKSLWMLYCEANGQGLKDGVNVGLPVLWASRARIQGCVDKVFTYACCFWLMDRKYVPGIEVRCSTCMYAGLGLPRCLPCVQNGYSDWAIGFRTEDSYCLPVRRRRQHRRMIEEGLRE